MDTKTIINAATDRMKRTVDHLDEELLNIRAGKASTNVLNSVFVDYYGSQTPVSGVASVTVPDARTILIQPWDKNMIRPIEKAIIDSNIGLTPSNKGETIRLTIPPLTEERRKELVKQVKSVVRQLVSACVMHAAMLWRHSRRLRRRACPRMRLRMARHRHRSCWRSSQSSWML